MRGTGALLIVLLLAMLGASPPARAVKGPAPLILGVQDDQLPVADPAALDARLDRLAATGTQMTRLDVLWNQVAPTRPADPRDDADPAYRWSRYDRIVDGLAARGIAVLVTIYRTPGWAVDTRYAPADPSEPERWAPDPQALGDLAHALARRYDGVRHGAIAAFEPWNEPNIPFFLRPQWVRDDGAYSTGWRPASPAIYAAMLRAARDGIRQAGSDAPVLGVSGAPNGTGAPPAGPASVGAVSTSAFIAELARLRAPMDAAAQHVYPALGPDESRAFPAFLTLPRLIGELDAIRPGIPVWITEFGWMTQAPLSRPARAFSSEADQAAFLDRAVAMMAAEPRIRTAIWFNLQDNAEWPGGLRRADDTAKPAWDAFRALPSRMPRPAPAYEPPLS